MEVLTLLGALVRVLVGLVCLLLVVVGLFLLASSVLPVLFRLVVVGVAGGPFVGVVGVEVTEVRVVFEVFVVATVVLIALVVGFSRGGSLVCGIFGFEVI